MIKFYILILLHEKFRNELSIFLRLKFYLDPKIIRTLNIFHRLQKSTATNDLNNILSSLSLSSKKSKNSKQNRKNSLKYEDIHDLVKGNGRTKKLNEKVNKFNFEFNTTCMPYKISKKSDNSSPDTSTNLFKTVKKSKRNIKKSKRHDSDDLTFIDKSTYSIRYSKKNLSKNFFSKIEAEKRYSKIISIMDNSEEEASSIRGYRL